MRTAKEMAKYSKEHNNWQLQGRVTFEEFKTVITKIAELAKLPGYIDNIEYWDYVVIIESLWRDRPSVASRYNNMLIKEAA
jgi:hypothetical protein